MGLLFYSFGLLPSVRVRCGLYPHGFTVLLFWFAPMCESSLWTVFTWVYYFTLLGLLPCVRVHCGLYPHGLSVLHLWFTSMCESSLWTVFTRGYYFILLVSSHV